MRKKERRLTPAELERKKIFEAKVFELAQQGYHKKDLTMGIVMVNVMAIVVMIPIIVLFCWLYIIINQQSISLNFDSIEAIIFIISIFALTILHEGIHGLTWALFSKEHFGAIMIIGGGGDALIILKLLFHKENGKESIYMDHPYECGVVVFERTILNK